MFTVGEMCDGSELNRREGAHHIMRFQLGNALVETPRLFHLVKLVPQHDPSLVRAGRPKPIHER